jgi:hypothetical protein
MTQYDDVVEKQRRINAAEAWAKQIKQIYGHDGIIETHYYNGDIHYEENILKGKEWTVKSNMNKNEILDNFSRHQADGGLWNTY